MPHTIDFNSEEQIIEVKARGTITLDEFKEIISQGLQLSREKQCFFFLTDFREATEIRLSTMAIFGMSQLITTMAGLLDVQTSNLKRANVVTLKHLDDAHFAENTLVNRGQTTRFFLDMDEAKQWLQEGK